MKKAIEEHTNIVSIWRLHEASDDWVICGTDESQQISGINKVMSVQHLKKKFTKR